MKNEDLRLFFNNYKNNNANQNIENITNENYIENEEKECHTKEFEKTLRQEK